MKDIEGTGDELNPTSKKNKKWFFNEEIFFRNKPNLRKIEWWEMIHYKKKGYIDKLNLRKLIEYDWIQ